jgi:hypothetical protein
MVEFISGLSVLLLPLCPSLNPGPLPLAEKLKRLPD